MNIDFHIHTAYSADALTKPQTLLRVANERNLAVAVTDHDTAAAWPVLKELNKSIGAKVIYGMEIKTTKDGEPTGELIGLFMNTPIRKTEYWDVIDAIHSQGALLSVPHPFDSLRHNFSCLEEILDKVDFIEAFNSRCWAKGANREAQKFARENNLIGIAGSDAHTPEEIGNAYVTVDADDLEVARRKILKREHTINYRECKLSDHLQTFLARHNIIKPR